MKKGLVILLILLAVTVVIAGGFGLYKFYLTEDEIYVCTQDAKMCPDGSAVGRTGPKCEFAPCLDAQKPIEPYADIIKVNSPQAKQIVASPIEIRGQARGSWYFEASFPVSLLDTQGNILARLPITAQGEWMTNDFVPFFGQISYQVATMTDAILVLENDNPSGLPENQKKIEIPLVLRPATISDEVMDVRVFFLNNNLDKEITCSKVFPVTRQIGKTQAVASATMAELFKGPTEGERAAGYSTTLPTGVKINKLSIAQGVAKIDFDGSIEKNVAGSCRVTAIRAEITQTLKQFSTVNEVIISVIGRTDDILQP